MTTQNTIEALMYELRNGLGALAEDGARGRLGRCDKKAMHQVIERLRPGKGGRYDPNWSDADIATLMVEWKRATGRNWQNDDK